MPGRKILVATDDPLNGLVLASQVAALSHAPVGPVTSEEDAVDALRSQAPHLAVLDAGLASDHGARLADRLFRVRAVPIVRLIEYEAARADASPVLISPVQDLVKPISVEDLQAGIDGAGRRFAAWRRQSRRIAEATRELDEGALLDRARSALVEWHRVSATDAAALLRRETSARRQTATEFARGVLTARALHHP